MPTAQLLALCGDEHSIGVARDHRAFHAFENECNIRMYFFYWNKINYFGTWVFGIFHIYFRRREVLRIVSTAKNVFY